jgi:hypothetical protein
MDDGIFVAHNVNFDYGSISYEYERLERDSAFRSFAFARECGEFIPATSPTALAVSAQPIRSNWRTIIVLSAMLMLPHGF